MAEHQDPVSTLVRTVRCFVTLTGMLLLPCTVSADNVLTLDELDGANGFVVQGPVDISFGETVGGVGDLTGDGLPEIGIGAQDADWGAEEGAVYILFGALSFPSSVSLVSPDGSDGFLLKGEIGAGISVAAAGDFNADGFDDLITGAPGINGGRGRAYIVYGHAPPYAGTLALGDLLDGVRGTRIDLPPVAYPETFLGWSVAGLGDVNGDGVDDVAVGAFEAQHPTTLATKVGAVFVIFGQPGGLGAVLEVSDLDGSNGFAFYGSSRYRTGSSVAATDVNGDGLADLVTGAPGCQDVAIGYEGGYAYVVFGKRQAYSAWFDATSLDGANGFTIKGPLGGSYPSQLGDAVAGSDLNGDGHGDVIVGAPNAEHDSHLEGAAYVVWGHSSDYPALIEAAAINGSDGTALYGYYLPAGLNGHVGVNAAGGFDFDGDGLQDLALGNPDQSVTEQRDGEAYIVLGQASGFSGPDQDLGALTEGTGVYVRGTAFLGWFGEAVGALGDVNGDGFDDLVVGQGNNGSYEGKAFVILGTGGPNHVFRDGFESGGTARWSGSS